MQSPMIARLLPSALATALALALLSPAVVHAAATATPPPVKKITTPTLSVVAATPPPVKKITTSALSIVARKNATDLRDTAPTLRTP